MIGSSASSFLLILLGFIFFFCLRPNRRFHIILAISIAYAFLLNGKWALLFVVLTFLNFYISRLFNHKPILNNLLAIFNIAVWFFFKLNTSGMTGFGSILFPLGFSIFIFQQLTYLLGKELKRQESFDEYLLYSIFFGNIATGPIFDFSDYSAQLKRRMALDSSSLYLGLIIFMLGFAKKIIFADSFAQITLNLFEVNKNFTGNLLIPFLLNKYEIYLNFLAFSEMAIGVSLIFGFKLGINFNRPFATTSILEFWKRWHITLVDWIRKYVFYPLLVSPISIIGSSGILLIVFIVFALWHDFTPNHILYALIQFVLVVLESRYGSHFVVGTSGFKKIGLVFIKWVFFYVVLISVPGLIFRSPDMANVARVLHNLISVDWTTSWEVFKFSNYGGGVILAFVLINELIESKLNVKKLSIFIKESPILVKLIFLFLYLLILFYFGQWDKAGHFIYSNY